MPGFFVYECHFKFLEKKNKIFSLDVLTFFFQVFHYDRDFLLSIAKYKKCINLVRGIPNIEYLTIPHCEEMSYNYMN